VPPGAGVERGLAHDKGSVVPPSDNAYAEPDEWDLALREQPVDVDRIDARRASAGLPVMDAMFDAGPAAGVAGRRWLAVAAVGLLVVAGFAMASAMRSPEIVAAIAASSNNAPQVQPLELLSLRHSLDSDGYFTVTGFVQNPATGREIESVEAVVYLFDTGDQYFAAGRAPLDPTVVRPGDESPFVIRVPNGSGVSRYRVGFRHPDGSSIAHVDRRGELPDGLTGDTLESPELAQPAFGTRPIDGAAGR
jgi:hypothetical protein